MFSKRSEGHPCTSGDTTTSEKCVPRPCPLLGMREHTLATTLLFCRVSGAEICDGSHFSAEIGRSCFFPSTFCMFNASGTLGSATLQIHLIPAPALACIPRSWQRRSLNVLQYVTRAPHAPNIPPNHFDPYWCIVLKTKVRFVQVVISSTTRASNMQKNVGRPDPTGR